MANFDEYDKNVVNLNIINASSSAALAIERFKMAMTLEADTPEAQDLQKRLLDEI